MNADSDVNKQAMRSTVELVRLARSLGDLDQVAALIEIAEAALALHSASRDPDPWITATVAEITGDAMQSVELYELALQQLKHFPQEPQFEWRISLASRLIGMGRPMDARSHLLSARAEAAGLGKTKSIERADQLLSQLASP